MTPFFYDANRIQKEHEIGFVDFIDGSAEEIIFYNIAAYTEDGKRMEVCTYLTKRGETFKTVIVHSDEVREPAFHFALRNGEWEKEINIERVVIRRQKW